MFISNNSMTHDLDFPVNTIDLGQELRRTGSLMKEHAFNLDVMHAKLRERCQEQFADYDQDGVKNLKSAKIIVVFFKIGSLKWVSKRHGRTLLRAHEGTCQFSIYLALGKTLFMSQVGCTAFCVYELVVFFVLLDNITTLGSRYRVEDFVSSLLLM